MISNAASTGGFDTSLLLCWLIASGLLAGAIYCWRRSFRGAGVIGWMLLILALAIIGAYIG